MMLAKVQFPSFYIKFAFVVVSVFLFNYIKKTFLVSHAFQILFLYKLAICLTNFSFIYFVSKIIFI
jgi:hypothetical protein